MSETMLALVKRGREAVLEERSVPVAGPTEVVVKTTAASLCAADVEGVTGELAVEDGLVLGHESVGTVHEVGALVRGFEHGERVAVAAGTPCGHCANCQRGCPGQCGGVQWGGYTAGMSRDGNMAEYFVVPDAGYNLVHIPDGVSDRAAVVGTDALMTGSTGSEMARIPLGGTVAVFGQGHIGLGATACARLRGPARLITVKARPGNEEVARAMGADYTLNYERDDPVAAILEMTDGNGVDCVIDASGTTKAFPDAIRATRFGGVISVISSYTREGEETLPIPLNDWGWGIGDKTIFGSFQKPGSEKFARLLELMDAGHLEVDAMVTDEYGLHEADRAFADLRARKSGMIKPLVLI